MERGDPAPAGNAKRTAAVQIGCAMWGPEVNCLPVHPSSPFSGMMILWSPVRCQLTIAPTLNYHKYKINTSTFRSSIYCSSKVLEVRWQGGRFDGPSFSPRWPRFPGSLPCTTMAWPLPSFLPSRYSIHPRCLEQVIVPTVVRGDEDVEEGHGHHAVRRFVSRISASVHGINIPNSTKYR